MCLGGGGLWQGDRKCMNFDRKEKMNFKKKKRDGGREQKGRVRLVKG